jgi:hypothetical protein
VQSSYSRLRGFADALDAVDEWHRSALKLLLRRCHVRIGEHFSDWLQKAQDPLGEHAHSIRAAAAFEMEHCERMRAAGDQDTIKVLSHIGIVVL